jgi:hypothetical protein
MLAGLYTAYYLTVSESSEKPDIEYFKSDIVIIRIILGQVCSMLITAITLL